MRFYSYSKERFLVIEQHNFSDLEEKDLLPIKKTRKLFKKHTLYNGVLLEYNYWSVDWSIARNK